MNLLTLRIVWRLSTTLPLSSLTMRWTVRYLFTISGMLTRLLDALIKVCHIWSLSKCCFTYVSMIWWPFVLSVTNNKLRLCKTNREEHTIWGSSCIIPISAVKKWVIITCALMLWGSFRLVWVTGKILVQDIGSWRSPVHIRLSCWQYRLWWSRLRLWRSRTLVQWWRTRYHQLWVQILRPRVRWRGVDVFCMQIVVRCYVSLLKIHGRMCDRHLKGPGPERWVLWWIWWKELFWFWSFQSGRHANMEPESRTITSWI